MFQAMRPRVRWSREPKIRAISYGWKSVADFVTATPRLVVTAAMHAATRAGSRVAAAWVPRRKGSDWSPPKRTGAANRSAKNAKSNLPRSRIRPTRW